MPPQVPVSTQYTNIINQGKRNMIFYLSLFQTIQKEVGCYIYVKICCCFCCLFVVIVNNNNDYDDEINMKNLVMETARWLRQ